MGDNKSKKDRLIDMNAYFKLDVQEYMEYISNMIKKLKSQLTSETIELKIQYDPNSARDFKYFLNEIDNFEKTYFNFSVNEYEKVCNSFEEIVNSVSSYKVNEYYAARRELLNIQESYETQLIFYKRNIEYLDDHFTLTMKNKGYTF